jgi:hypothetical protein
MKCTSVLIYYSKDKPVAYTLILEGAVKPSIPAELSGLKVVKTSFARAYVRFANIRVRWNPDGTPRTHPPRRARNAPRAATSGVKGLKG